jgi:carboxyl-terminal processing protease
MRSTARPRHPRALAPIATALAASALSLLVLAPAGGATPPAKTVKPAESPAFSEDSWNLVQKVFGLVLRDYVDPKTPDQVIRGALQGAASAAGAESAYIPPEEVEAFRSAEKCPVSLPFYVTKGEDFARVLACYPGLEKGPEQGDFLKSIDGTSTYDNTYPGILALMAGKPGAKAQCVFLKREAFETYRLTLPFLPPPAAEWVPCSHGGALVLASLPSALPPRVEASLKESRSDGVLVDLRSCAQGEAQAALALAGVLLGRSEGPVSKGQKGETKHPLNGAGILAGKKVKVLIGPGTARGGEVLARALENSGALCLGEASFGWAPVIEVFPLDDGGLLRINTGFFLDRDGNALKAHGIEPKVKMVPEVAETRQAFYERALAARAPAPGKEPVPAKATAEGTQDPPKKNGQ